MTYQRQRLTRRPWGLMRGTIQWLRRKNAGSVVCKNVRRDEWAHQPCQIKFEMVTIDGLSRNGAYDGLATFPTSVVPVCCTNGQTGTVLEPAMHPALRGLLRHAFGVALRANSCSGASRPSNRPSIAIDPGALGWWPGWLIGGECSGLSNARRSAPSECPWSCMRRPDLHQVGRPRSGEGERRVGALFALVLAVLATGWTLSCRGC